MGDVKPSLLVATLFPFLHPGMLGKAKARVWIALEDSGPVYICEYLLKSLLIYTHSQNIIWCVCVCVCVCVYVCDRIRNMTDRMPLIQSYLCMGRYHMVQQSLLQCTVWFVEAVDHISTSVATSTTSKTTVVGTSLIYYNTLLLILLPFCCYHWYYQSQNRKQTTHTCLKASTNIYSNKQNNRFVITPNIGRWWRTTHQVVDRLNSLPQWPTWSHPREISFSRPFDFQWPLFC